MGDQVAAASLDQFEIFLAILLRERGACDDLGRLARVQLKGAHGAHWLRGGPRRRQVGGELLAVELAALY